jgi:hypothetical protein
MLSMVETPRRAGASRSASHRAIKDRRRSASKGAAGRFEIDGAEMARVCPPVERTEAHNAGHSATPESAMSRPKQGVLAGWLGRASATA